MKEIKIITKNHLRTKRNYLDRMLDEKVKCMNIASKYGREYWDGKRRYGYGGYKFIKGFQTPVALKIIKNFKLTNKSRIIDIGCGKGFLIYEIKKILPGIEIVGLDISKYAKSKSKNEIKEFIKIHKAEKRLPFKSKYFDLAISINCFHNLQINHLKIAITELTRVSKKQYIAVESYRNNKELFNLQCWALTCQSFFNKNEWKWILNENNYNGFYEFIYFT